ncbi:MAG: murein hydrolase activator EnvC family protein, partial [Acutalibacteraceae bacterium]
IAVSHEKINALDERISDLTEKVKTENKNIEKQMNTLRGRIKTIYMSGEVSSLEIILGAKDFGDFLDKVQLVKNVSSYDEELIGEIKVKIQSITEKQEELAENKDKLQSEKSELEEKQKDLNILLEENKAVLSELYKKSESQQDDVDKAEKELSGLEGEISAYYKAQAAKKAAQNNSSSNQGSGSSASIHVSASGFTWPVPGYYSLSSVFGEDRGSYGHGAIDIAGGGIMGATVVAAYGGTVVASNRSCTHNWGKSGSCGCGGGYGNYVWIDHGNGKATIYGHLSSLTVSTGATVSKGQVIGYVGSTGESSGAHLHFECRYNGVRYDPMSEF